MVSRIAWRGNAEFHTLLETLATQLALTTGTIALVRYYAKRSSLFLLIGVAFLGAGFLDAYHAVITSSFLVGRTPSVFSALTQQCCSVKGGGHSDALPRRPASLPYFRWHRPSG
jgi:hypothetical protein